MEEPCRADALHTFDCVSGGGEVGGRGGSLGECVRGCVGVWVSESVRVWECGSVGVWECGSVGVWVCNVQCAMCNVHCVLNGQWDYWLLGFGIGWDCTGLDGWSDGMEGWMERGKVEETRIQESRTEQSEQ